MEQSSLRAGDLVVGRSDDLGMVVRYTHSETSSIVCCETVLTNQLQTCVSILDLKRAEISLGSWIRSLTDAARSQTLSKRCYRVGEIRTEHTEHGDIITYTYDAMVDEKGKFCSYSRKHLDHRHAFVPVEDPKSVQQRKKDAMVSKNYQVGDLACMPGLDTPFVVIDAGMGKPRAQMRLKEVNGKREAQNVCETLLTRPPLKRGDWVRCLKPQDHRYRKRIVNAEDQTLHLDWEEFSGVAEEFRECFATVHPNYWVPVATPENFQPAGAEKVNRKLVEDNAGLRGENCGLRSRITGLEADNAALLAELEAKRDEVAAEMNAKCSAISECNGKMRSLKSELEFMRALLKNTKKEATDALAAHEGAIGQRNKERQGKWDAQEHLRESKEHVYRLREALEAKTKENERLLELYEGARAVAEVRQPQKPVVM